MFVPDLYVDGICRIRLVKRMNWVKWGMWRLAGSGDYSNGIVRNGPVYGVQVYSV